MQSICERREGTAGSGLMAQPGRCHALRSEELEEEADGWRSGGQYIPLWQQQGAATSCRVVAGLDSLGTCCWRNSGPAVRHGVDIDLGWHTMVCC